MIRLKTVKDIEGIALSGKIAASIIKELASNIRSGIILKDFEQLASSAFKRYNAKPAFLEFKPNGAENPYPFSICTSVNEIIVHGQPTDYQLKEGDILKIDLGVIFKGYYSDTAFTYAIGEVAPMVRKLIEATQKALNKAIAAAKVNNTLGDIGFAIEKTAKSYGFSVIKALTGHGTGFSLHEDPTVYNFGKRGEGIMLEPGMVLAIEPMLSLGSNKIKKQKDDSYITSDKSLSAHFEHTIAITNKGSRILTS